MYFDRNDKLHKPAAPLLDKDKLQPPPTCGAPIPTDEPGWQGTRPCGKPATHYSLTGWKGWLCREHLIAPRGWREKWDAARRPILDKQGKPIWTLTELGMAQTPEPRPAAAWIRYKWLYRFGHRQ
jgi:hypothetical protein